MISIAPVWLAGGLCWVFRGLLVSLAVFVLFVFLIACWCEDVCVVVSVGVCAWVCVCVRLAALSDT